MGNMKPSEVKNKVENSQSTVVENSRTQPVHAPEGEKVEVEHGGPRGPEPTRYGDWERKGRCIDF